jgi:Ran GTPase-activating protein 1
VAFLSTHTPLRKLILNNNGLGPRAGKLIADALSDLAVKKEEARKAGQDIPNLETVVCGRNRLENGSMAAWAKAFAAHNGVKEVKMTQNGIRPEGIEVLIRQGLKHATGLQVLDLEDNTFALPGATALADVVPSWHHLTDLGVNDCLLGKTGSVLLTRALQTGSKSLEVLRLTFNDVDLHGLNELELAIVGKESSLQKLRRIELNGNRFSEEERAVAAIRECLLERVGGTEKEEPVMDELADMDEESSEEEERSEGEEEEEEEEEVEEKAEKLIKDDETAEDEPVAAEEDKAVDDLATKLGGTTI